MRCTRLIYETINCICHVRSRQRWLSFVSLDYMHTSLIAAFLLVTFPPFLMPRAAHSKYFRTESVGNSWRNNGTAGTDFTLTISADAPRPLYVEAMLPAPDGSTAETISKTVRAGESRVSFEGPVKSGWRPNKTYVFRLRAYADAAHKQMIDSLEQHSVCVKPPDYLLRQLKSSE